MQTNNSCRNWYLDGSGNNFVETRGVIKPFGTFGKSMSII